MKGPLSPESVQYVAKLHILGKIRKKWAKIIVVVNTNKGFLIKKYYAPLRL
jgi:hypothetical protein